MIPGLYKIFDHWHAEGTVYIYSDPHFNDQELVAGVPERPSAEEQVKLINSKVGKKDTLIILGDCGDPAMCAKLRGYKVLIMGNHDAGRSNYERKVVKKIYDKEHWSKSEVLDKMKQLYPGCKYSISEKYDFHDPFIYWEVSADNNLFDEVYEGPLMIGEKLILSHEPLNAMPWVFNIHGHIHDRRHKDDTNHLNVCSDVINYTPVNLNRLMKRGLTAKIQSVHRQTIDVATKRARKRKLKNKECYDCKHFYRDWFCGYAACRCHKHGSLDCDQPKEHRPDTAAKHCKDYCYEKGHRKQKCYF